MEQNFYPYDDYEADDTPVYEALIGYDVAGNPVYDTAVAPTDPSVALTYEQAETAVEQQGYSQGLDSSTTPYPVTSYPIYDSTPTPPPTFSSYTNGAPIQSELTQISQVIGQQTVYHDPNQSSTIVIEGNDVEISDGVNTYRIKAFIQKHPRTFVQPNTELIVHEGQEAILQFGGEVLRSLGPGRYGLNDIDFHLTNDGSTTAPTNHVDIYFVNIIEQMGILWGTPTRVRFLEPQYHFPLSIGASGDMALAVRAPQRLFMKLVGTDLILSHQTLLNYFQSLLVMHIKTAIAQVIQETKASVFELDAHLSEIAQKIKDLVQPIFADYGIELTQFSVTTIDLPENDPVFQQFKHMHFEEFERMHQARIEQQAAVIAAETVAKNTVITAEAIAKKRELEKYTYQQEREYDLTEKLLSNEAVSTYANAQTSLQLLSGLGEGMGRMIGGSINHALQHYGPPTALPLYHAPGASVAQPVPETSKPADSLHQVLGAASQLLGGGAAAAATALVPGADAAQTTVCPYCSTILTGTETFCPNCGRAR